MSDAPEAVKPPANPALPQSRYCTVCRAVYSNDVKFCPKDGAALEMPQQVLGGRFVLKERIGAGNMGTVHRAVQLPMGREVAVKLLHAEMALNPDMVARFEHEALAASTVDHPNAITIYDSGKTDDNQVFIAMEFLDGESLSAILRREHRLLPERALELLMPAVKAMVVAHRKGVLHRDLKPDNIFVAKKVNEEGATEEVIKVLDFGIAKLLEGHRGNRAAIKTVAGVRIGTAMYMAPEQLEGREASKQSDVYALGLILIELIIGRMPWGRGGDEGDTMLTMLRLVNPPLPLAELCPDQTFSADLQKFFHEVLAIDPTKRPADAGELLRRIGQLPEATALSQGGAKRSEISLMMAGSSMSADLARYGEGASPGGAPMTTLPMAPSPLRAAEPGAGNPADETLPPAKELPHVPTKVKALPVAEGRAADPGNPSDDTIPHRREPEGASSASELPQVPTKITGGNRLQPLTAGPPATGAATPAASAESRSNSAAPTLPVVQPVKSLHSSNMPTLPTGVSAPRLQGGPADPAPTVPMQVARLPKGVAAAARLATTLPSIGPSSATLRAEGDRSRQWLRFAVLAVGALLLTGVAYLMLRPNAHPKPTQQTPVEPAAALLPEPPPERPDAAIVRAPQLPPGEETAGPRPPPGPRPTPGPRPAPRPSSGEDSGRHRSVQVTFLRRRPTQISIVCGSSQRPCAESCSVSPGEQCLARSPGYQPKRFPYEELRGRASHGRVRIEVKLTAAP